tara:strand:- start:722 stop:1126 length:405 start_codon:yes stop_codon:yes gene_type:complete
MSGDDHAHDMAQHILGRLRRQSSEQDDGGKLRRIFADVERYCIDFGALQFGWDQFDTDQDAPYFGVWTHDKQREVLTVCEGDWTLSTYDDDASYARALAQLREYYGKAPPECRVIGSDGKLRGMSLREALGGDE